MKLSNSNDFTPSYHKILILHFSQTFFRDTGSSDDPIMVVESEVGDDSIGVPINRINLYAFGGNGEMAKLKLTINPNGCAESKITH